ncbi:chymotrypsin-like protease CTRL-1 [Homarus americanus]|uniref:chymotrypsin-like protease CTRL-1 n=1 Tax=Homarus americanus TaxID=6706 RepID=UPI001C45A8A3|nr:chymotrypsin-like protease CTRL-1 [Homarus americanus]
MVGRELEGVFVYLGAHEFPDTNDTSTAVVASLVSVHDAYDDYKKLNDIALVKLSSPANFTLKVSPACLGLDGDVQVGDKVVVAGWGKLTNEGDEFPKTLMKVDLEVVDPMICKESYNGTIEINDNMMCSFASGKDSCVGDSGGPLLVEVGLGQWVAVGVVSFGAGCAQEYPGIYTRVSKYHNWINEIVQDPQC